MNIKNILMCSLMFFSGTAISVLNINVEANIRSSTCTFDALSSNLNVNAGNLKSTSPDGFHKTGGDIRLSLENCDIKTLKKVTIKGNHINNNMWREKNIGSQGNDAGTAFGIGIAPPSLYGDLQGNVLNCTLFDRVVTEGECTFLNQTNIISGEIVFTTGIIKKTYTNASTDTGRVMAIVNIEMEFQ